jgi:outer membrane lipoprotein carrier protein
MSLAGWWHHQARVLWPGVMLGGTLLLAGNASAQTPSETLARVARTYQGLSSFSADFWQVIDDPMLGNYRSRGRLVQVSDGRLSLRFTEPAGELIVLDGRHVWMYLPSTEPGQVRKIPMSSLPDYFNPRSLLDQPARRFEARSVRRDQINGRPADVVLLTPRDADLPFSEVSLWVDREDGLPRRLQFKERSGATRTFTFADVLTNQRIPDRTFTFDIPPGVRVVDAM